MPKPPKHERDSQRPADAPKQRLVPVTPPSAPGTDLRFTRSEMVALPAELHQRAEWR